MRTTLIVLLALPAPLVAVPSAAAHNHCDELPYTEEIPCRVWAAIRELVPPIVPPALPVEPVLP